MVLSWQRSCERRLLRFKSPYFFVKGKKKNFAALPSVSCRFSIPFSRELWEKSLIDFLGSTPGFSFIYKGHIFPEGPWFLKRRIKERDEERNQLWSFNECARKRYPPPNQWFLRTVSRELTPFISHCVFCRVKWSPLQPLSLLLGQPNGIPLQRLKPTLWLWYK